MEKEPTISELINKIKLMELALEFYANDKNYVQMDYDSAIDKDHGHQARFALAQIKKISDYENSLLKEVNRISIEITNQVGDDKPSAEEIIAQLNKMKEELNKHTE